MTIDKLKIELKQLIAKGKNEAALEKLMEVSGTQSTETTNLIYSLSSSFETYKRNINYGTLSEENEKQFANELTFRLLRIVDALEEPKEVKPKEKDAIKPVPVINPQPDVVADEKINDPEIIPKRNFTTWLLPLAGISLLVFAIVMFSKMNGKTTDPNISVNYNKLWLGKWEHQLYTKANPDIITKGQLRFQRIDNSIAGTGLLIYPAAKSSTAKLQLKNIDIKGSVMTGDWQTDIVDPNNPQKGSFEFKLSKDHKTFSGTYVFINKNNIRHHWNGRKK